MSEDLEIEKDEMQILKSQHADEPAYVTFCNRTTRTVDIFWLNYKGKRVKYCSLSPEKKNFHVNTFVTHPWLFREKDTENIMTANKKSIFFPEAWDGRDQRTIAYIDIKVYALRDMCMQLLRRQLPKECMPDLEIPKLLKKELLDTQCQSHDTYKDGAS